MYYQCICKQQKTGSNLLLCKTTLDTISTCKASAKQIWGSEQSLENRDKLFVFHAKGAIKTVTYLMKSYHGYISLYKTFDLA